MKRNQWVRLALIATVLIGHFLALLIGFYWGRIEGQNNLWDTQWSPNRYVETFPAARR